jgi:hypothetical protein
VGNLKQKFSLLTKYCSQTKTMAAATTAISAGEPTGHLPPRFHAHQQAHADACDDNNDDNDDNNDDGCHLCWSGINDDDNTVTAATTTPWRTKENRQHKSNKMRRWLVAGDAIINDRWTVGGDKEGSGQAQTTTNHCAADERRPAERAASNEKGVDDANEEDKQRGGG